MRPATVKFVLAAATVLMGGTTMSGQQLVVTVVTAKSKAVLSAASVLVRSSAGYILGSEYQDFHGFYVTEPVIPPEGINLKTTLVNWKNLRKVEFTDWSVKEGNRYFVKATLTLTSGSSRDVFVWQPSSGDSFTNLQSSSVKITGKMPVQGTEQDVEIKPGGDLKSLEFVFPLGPDSLTYEPLPDPTGKRVLLEPQVAAANLVTKVDPVYPPSDRHARIQGAVQLMVTLGTDGGILNLQVLSAILRSEERRVGKG